MPGRTLRLRIPPPRTRAIARETLEGQGWRLLEEEGGALVLERGRQGGTIVLGGLSGRSLHLTARLAVTGVPGGSEVRYAWDSSSGRILGGRLGARRARTVHGRSLAALEDRFLRSGVLTGIADDDPQIGT